MPRPLCLLAGLPVLLLGSLVRAQVEPDAHSARHAHAEAAATAVHMWVDLFARGKIKPRDEVFLSKSSSSGYVKFAVKNGVINARGSKRTTHFSLLQRIVGRAEKFQSRSVAEALLALSASGYSGDLYAPATIMVRDQGHFALMRAGSPTIWNHILSVATGTSDDSSFSAADVPPVVVDEADEGREREITETASIMRRVAAVRLLGMKGNSVFRLALEKCLTDADPRVRLAAAEAFGQLRDLKYLYSLTRKAEAESHPLVVMGMLSAIDRTLKKFKGKVPIGRAMNTTRSLIRLLGRKGWRNDMTIVRMVREYPVKSAVPALISLMRAAQAEIDPILKVVNKNASPILADEVYQTLRMITGALLPAKPNKWQKFWEAEKGKLQLVAPYRRRRASRGGTKGTFFGIPVVGREVVFVIDTSGSMKEAVENHTVVPNGKKKRKGDEGFVSRLDVAKNQTLNAVQGIPTSTCFHLVTFAAGIRVWNQKPVRVGAPTFRSLTEALGRLHAVGGTNVYAALLHVLGASQLRFGQQIKNGVEEVFLLSDGEPSVGSVKDPEEILRVVREINRYQKIRINTVFTGTDKGAEFMRKLAEQNHGVFVRR